MPIILRILCQGAMVVCPLFLVFLSVPGIDWEIDGAAMTYRALWTSGMGTAIAASLASGAGGSWALANRTSAGRWLLVLMPLAPALVLVAYRQLLAWDSLVSAALTSAGIWLYLFRLKSVNDYLTGGRQAGEAGSSV